MLPNPTFKKNDSNRITVFIAVPIFFFEFQDIN